MMRARMLPLCAILSLLASAACEGRDIVVFSPAQPGSMGGGGPGSAGVPMTDSVGSAGSSAGSLAGAGNGGTGGMGGSGGDFGARACESTNECDPSWYCAKQTCADSTGYCVPRPVSDDPLLNPVCGCEDRITYWNDTLRQAYGISASVPGSCQVGASTCSINGDECGPNGTCSHQLPDLASCSMPGQGQCWIIPTDCSSDDKLAWLPCPPPGPPPGTPPPCLTTCQVLQAGWPYVRLHRGDHCQ